ncbi:tyrosine-type recombinase/integrase [Alphaproteobacteria bacterium LSUCC0226]
MNVEKLFTSFEGEYAPNTTKAYRSDFEQLTHWRKQNKLNPLSLSVIHFVQYLEEMGKSLTVATMSRRVASTSRLLDLLKQPNPSKEPDVILGFKRLKRNLGIAQKQTTPLTLEVMRKLQAECDDSNAGLRNRLLLQLGYESMRRRSEIYAFKFDNVKILPNGKHALLLRKSKTDQFGEGKLIPISDKLVKMIDNWQDEIKQPDRHILRSFRRDLSYS